MTQSEVREKISQLSSCNNGIYGMWLTLNYIEMGSGLHGAVWDRTVDLIGLDDTPRTGYVADAVSDVLLSLRLTLIQREARR